MHKNILLLIIFFLLSQCSLDTKTGFWTKTKIIEKKKIDLEDVFKPEEVLDKEFNSDLKLKINSKYTKNPFVNNLTNNSGFINFESNFKEISKFKFKKIKNFENISPDLLIGKDKSITFFDEKGSILKFNEQSK